MGRDNKVTHHFRMEFFNHVANGEEVTQRLRHLFAINVNEAGMHPAVHILFASTCFRLCNFIFMMWEGQISTAAMDIQMIAQTACGHCRAFNMPAWTAIAPRSCPLSIILSVISPQYEARSVLLTAY